MMKLTIRNSLISQKDQNFMTMNHISKIVILKIIFIMKCMIRLEEPLEILIIGNILILFKNISMAKRVMMANKNHLKNRG